MRTHTNNYKNEIKNLGREIDARVTYNGTTITSENINSVSLHYEGAILKSVMKQLDLELNIDIPVNSILTAEFGLKVNGAYEYINLGNFVVYKSEKQEDTSSYKLTCYDKILYSMVDYETPKVNGTEITYPITIRSYLSAICSHLGLTFSNTSDTFTNYDKEIPNELYLDSDGNSLNYTFRDVLDELAEVTASTICINNDDKLEIRYINDTNDTIDEEFLKDVNVNFGEVYGPVNTVILTRAEADSISQSIPSNLPDEDKIAIEIKDNQIMNFNDRGDYLSEILTQLNGLTYYLNDFASTGITYYELCDKYNVSIDNQTYSCIMLNDEINITQGLEENVYTEMPQQAEVEYKYTTETDKAVREASIIIDKKISQVDIKGKTINLTADDINIDSNNFKVDSDGKITATAGDIAGYEIDTNSQDGTKYLMASAYPDYDYTRDDWLRVMHYLDGTGAPLTPEEVEKYDLNKDGVVDGIDFEDLTRIRQLGITTTNGVYVELQSNKNILGLNGMSLIAGDMVLFNVDPFYGLTLNNGGRVYGERILYSGDSNGTITLVDEIDEDLGIEFYISQYNSIEIFGTDNNGQKGVYAKLTDLADGNTFMLSTVEAGTGTYIRRTKYTINDNKLVPSNGGYVYITSGGNVQTNSSQNYIRITKVIGYK